MSATARRAQNERGQAELLGIKPGQIVQELGYDTDSDEQLRQAIAAVEGVELVDEDYEDVVDVVLMWFREDDGDLLDALADALVPLEDGGYIWLLTPKAGRSGHVEPSDIGEAASGAGLAQTSSVSAARDWTGSRLVLPRRVINRNADDSALTQTEVVHDSDTREVTAPKSSDSFPWMKEAAHFLSADARTRDPRYVESEAVLPISIYLSNERIHDEVEVAVEDWLADANLAIEERDEPIIGSWFRKLRAGVKQAVNTPAAQDALLTAAHAVDTRMVLAQDAVMTATLLQGVAPVIASLQPTKDAVVRAGAVLIVKVDWAVQVHQLTAAQQVVLDHQPKLLSSPTAIVEALQLGGTNGDGVASNVAQLDT